MTRLTSGGKISILIVDAFSRDSDKVTQWIETADHMKKKFTMTWRSFDITFKLRVSAHLEQISFRLFWLCIRQNDQMKISILAQETMRLWIDLVAAQTEKMRITLPTQYGSTGIVILIWMCRLAFCCNVIKSIRYFITCRQMSTKMSTFYIHCNRVVVCLCPQTSDVF